MIKYKQERFDFHFAAVAEQADARDLKSLDSNIVPVRSRSAAPRKKPLLSTKAREVFVYLNKFCLCGMINSTNLNLGVLFYEAD